MPQDRVPQHKRRLATDNEEVKKDIQEQQHKTSGKKSSKEPDKEDKSSEQKRNK